MSRARNIVLRLCGIAAFGRTGLALQDKLKMLLVGYARGHTFDSSDPIARIGKALFPEIAVHPRQLKGMTLYLDPSDLAQLVVADELLVQHVYDFDLVPFDPDLIFDCGAHVGIFTLMAVARFPKSRIIAFEPDPTNLKRLRRHVLANRRDIEVVDAAVFVRDGEERFEQSVSCGGFLNSGGSDGSTGILVRTIRLRDFLLRFKPHQVLLKIDIEGAEETVLSDIIDVLPSECAIFFETHAGDPSWHRAKVLLETNGFEVTLRRWREPYGDGFALRGSTVN